jgi:hypothetical protein
MKSRFLWIFTPKFWKFLKRHFDRRNRKNKTLQCLPKHSNPDFDFIWNSYFRFLSNYGCHRQIHVFIIPLSTENTDWNGYSWQQAGEEVTYFKLLTKYWLGGTDTKNGINVSINLFLLGQGILIIEAARLHPDTPHSQETDIHAPGGIRTRNPSRRAATDTRLRPRDHWDRLAVGY